MTDISISLIDLATQVNSSYGYDFPHRSKHHTKATELNIAALEKGNPAAQALALKEKSVLYYDKITLYPNMLPGSSLLRKIAGGEIFGVRPGWAKPIRLKQVNERNQFNYFVFKHENLLYYLDLELFMERCFALKRRLKPAQKPPASTDPLYPLFTLYHKDEDLKKFIDEIDPDQKDIPAYSVYIKKKFKTLKISQYGWANDKQKSYLIPSRLFTVIEKIDISAPALTAANLFVDETPNVYPWDFIGEMTVVFANMIYIPWIAYGLHRKLEIAAYQYKYNGRNPAANGQYMAIVQNDAMILSAQSLAISIFEGFVIDEDLMCRVGNFSADIVSDAITATTPAEIKFLYHAGMAILCGAILGFAMLGIAWGATYHNPIYPKNDSQWKSLALGFLAGMSMYIMASSTKPSNGLRVAYELLMNPFVAVCLHHAHSKNRYLLTPDEQHLPRNDIRPSLLAREITVKKTASLSDIRNATSPLNPLKSCC